MRPGSMALRNAARAVRTGTGQTFAGEFALRGVFLPLTPSTDAKEIGVLRDARGHVVLVVDVESERTNTEAAAIAALIAKAVNGYEAGSA